MTPPEEVVDTDDWYPLDPVPLPFSTPIGDVVQPVAITFGDKERVAVLLVDERRGGQVRCRLYSPSTTDPLMERVDVNRDLGDVAISLTTEKPMRAFALPPGNVQQSFTPLRPLAGVGAVAFGALAIFVSMMTISDAQLRGFFTMLFVALTAGALYFLLKRGAKADAIRFVPGEKATSHFNPLLTSGYRFSQLLRERPDDGRAAKLVAQVKDEYGSLLSDIVVRIEQPALFDPAVPATRDFTDAMILWDNSQATMTPSERSDAAAQVRITFDAAVQNAQTLGLDHVPADKRAEVERAAKAARLSKSTRGPESRTALQQAINILQALRLYYMPDAAEAEAIVGGKARLALPGRRLDPDGPMPG